MSEGSSSSHNKGNIGDPKYQDEWVVLNVGGKVFHTTISTLTSIQNTLFHKMFSKESQIPVARKDSNGAFLIDRDPKYFRVLLNYLRSPSNILVIDKDISVKGVLLEAQFFQIEPLIELIDKQENNKSDFSRKDILLYKSTIKLTNRKLVGLDLSNLEFVKENFNQSDISECKFTHTKLSHSTLMSVRGKRCIFNCVTAENTIFSNSNLNYSAFTHSVLTHASFNNAHLSHSNFSNSNCYGTLYQRAVILNGSFKDANLEHAKFQKANLQFSDFTGASLQNSHFTGSDIRGCTFDWKSIPSNVIFKKAKISVKQYHEIQLANKSTVGFKILDENDNQIDIEKLESVEATSTSATTSS